MKDRKTMKAGILLLFGASMVLAGSGCDWPPGAGVRYDPDIKQLMTANCFPCHLSVSVSGGVILDTYDGVKAAVESTGLVNAINHNAGYSSMPEGTAKLAQSDIDTIQTWIKNGSFDPEPIDGVFIQPFQSCQGLESGDNLTSEDGLVCTSVAISGSTEENRSFMDYGSCDVVLTQRPYWYKAPFNSVDPSDPRLDNATFMAELNWINRQVRASGCICCHDSVSSGRPAAVWDISAQGVWTDQLSDQGVAILAGKVSSEILGKFTAGNNNGFDRDSTGFPTTDVERVQTFFNNELARRGVTDTDIAEMEDFGSFIVDIIEQPPDECSSSQGVLADGKIYWNSNEARYIYIKEAGSENPGVPPSNDNPEGVLWRLDVMPNVAALNSGEVGYGEVPEGTYQVTPDNGTAPALESGKAYHLYVLKDILIPVGNCIFTAP